MTAPAIDLPAILPLKYKTIVAAVGSALTFLGPWILSSTDALPAPWPAVVGGIFWVLTVLGVYHAPYRPAGTALVPNEQVLPPTAVVPNVNGSYRNPWK